ncbi:uncharacterized protein LOC122860174 isoform X2 [Aphidius gifuensis]|uniref:uncharacterized protein LOC122860174 isoform X2 n=1 Tax=Aphidius gifuensis TaxID=684658 RepID=UPI001CDBB7A9|nr:uncharacterized protein LOC122860174 isoform X2 [Aphidius gifuensis]
MKVLLFYFILCCIISCCIADDYDDKKTFRDIYHPRKKGKHELLFLLGGVQSIAAFVIFKIKIILVVMTIIGVGFLALKFFGIYKYSNYLYKDNNYPIIEGPIFEHGHYPFQHDHVKHEEYGNEWSSAPSYYSRSDKNNYSPTLFYQEPHFINNIENIIYSLINMSNENCQKRFLCQLKKLTISSTNLSTAINDCTKSHSNCSDEKTVKFRRRRLQWDNLNMKKNNNMK